MTFVGKIFPNGEFGLSKYVNTVGRQKSNDSSKKKEGRCGGGEESGETDIGLANDFISHSGDGKPSGSRRRRGSKGLTKAGGRLIRNGAYLLEEADKKVGGRSIVFATLTLPNLGEDRRLSVGSNWSSILRVFFQRLGRLLKRRGLPGEYVGVSEIQEKRFKKTGKVWLHIHFCYQGRRGYEGGRWRVAPKEIREMWRSVIVHFVGEVEGEDWNYCENLQVVRKSVANYLSKYLSKGKRFFASSVNSNCIHAEVLPSSWYSMSASLKKDIKRRTLSEYPFLFELVRMIRMEIEKEERLHFKVLGAVKIKEGSTGVSCTIGWWGVLSEKGRKEIWE